jgi:hypothetical protein
MEDASKQADSMNIFLVVSEIADSIHHITQAIAKTFLSSAITKSFSSNL